MRILFLSNFYPPARPGGYTQWCHEVAEGLRDRGHEIAVLTSRHEREKAAADEKNGSSNELLSNVYRLLHLEGELAYYSRTHFFTRWKRQRRENEAIVRSTIEAFNPDLVFVWGMWAMWHGIPATAERLLPSRVVYFLSDYWPAAVDMHTAYWREPARHWYTKAPRWLLSRLALAMIKADPVPELRFERAICVSAAVRQILVDAGLPFEEAQVIHGGTRLNGFKTIRQRRFDSQRLKLVYAGQLVEHKGVHTAIEALDRLVNESGITDLHLEVVGSGHPDYERYLAAMVREGGLQAYVTFRGQVGKTEIPTILQEADVLVFPSIYEEPFARMTQEAMLAGLVVVGTTTGGTKEILEDGCNGLTFQAGDAEALSRQLARLLQDRTLCRRLAQAGRQTVLENYTLDIMVERIEAYLIECESYL